jgi:hypothetical protein
LQPSRTVHGVQLFLLNLKLLLLSPQLDGSLNTLLSGPLLPVMTVVVAVLVVLLVLVVAVSRLRLGLGLLVFGGLTVRRLRLGLVILRRLAVRRLRVTRGSSGGFTALGVVVPVVAYRAIPQTYFGLATRALQERRRVSEGWDLQSGAGV